jgi:hypothetical protein
MSQYPSEINECDVIIITPMVVNCSVVHPTSVNSADGSATLIIQGGTPPYTVSWDIDGNEVLGNNQINLSVGQYSAIVSDYYNDFTVQTTCVLTGETDCSFSISVEEIIFPTPTPTPTITPTSTPGVTPTPTSTPGVTPTPTSTPGVTPTPTSTPGVTPTPTSTPGVTPTPTSTPGVTPTPSSSQLPSGCICGFMNPQPPPSCSSIYTVEYYKCGENFPTFETFDCNVVAVLCVDQSQPDPTTFDGSATWIPSSPPELCDNNAQCGGGGSQQRQSFTPCYYTVTITGGTSDGPYTIYYDVVSPNNIAAKHPSGGIASNLTLSEMVNGVDILVPCSANVILVFNELCNTTQVASVTPNIPINSFCITYSGGKQVSLVGNGYDSNGNPTWISTPTTECEVFWDTTINQWKLTCLLDGTQAYSNSPISSNPPINGWYTVGPVQPPLTVNQGGCFASKTLTFSPSVNQPECECDGTIGTIPTGGTPPYQYSINNGLTYFNSPIFTNLCPGTYSITVKDNDNVTTNNSVVLTSTFLPTTYNLTLNTVSNIITNTPTIYEVSFLTTLNISPAIPPGVNITVDLGHLGIFENLGTSNYSTLIRSVVLKKNQTPITITNTNTSNYVLPAPPQCLLVDEESPSISRQFSATTNNWNLIAIGVGDIITIETNSKVIKTSQSNQCRNGVDVNTFSVTNPSISGCSCCDVAVFSLQPTDQLPTPTPTPTNIGDLFDVV